MQESEGLTQSRTERGRVRSSRRKKIAVVTAAIVATMAVAGAVAWLGTRHAPARPKQLHAAASSAHVATVVPASTLATKSVAVAYRIEVPDLGGMSIAQASTVLRAAGLAMRISTDGTAGSAGEVVVNSQLPAPGTVASAGATVVISVPSLSGRSSRKPSSKRVKTRYTVVIDPGHQSRANDALEPIGPGSLDSKARVTAGATGVTSGVPEYEVDLEIATNLQRRLEAAGVRVVMTRTTNDVDISNAERAAVANTAKADLFVRVHADSSTDPHAAGISTLYPAANPWTKPIVGSSRRAAALVQQHLLSATGAQNGGSTPRPDLAGFNWSKVPAVLVQTGFQSNAVEDKLLSSAHYQDLLGEGMADGILAYLKGGR